MKRSEEKPDQRKEGTYTTFLSVGIWFPFILGWWRSRRWSLCSLYKLEERTKVWMQRWSKVTTSHLKCFKHEENEGWYCTLWRFCCTNWKCRLQKWTYLYTPQKIISFLVALFLDRIIYIPVYIWYGLRMIIFIIYSWFWEETRQPQCWKKERSLQGNEQTEHQP